MSEDDYYQGVDVVIDLYMDRAMKAEATVTRLRGLLRRYEWNLVKDDMPDEKGYYLVCWNYEGCIETGECWYDSSCQWVSPHYGSGEKENPPEPPEITHWMAMPLPPIEFAKELER